MYVNLFDSHVHSDNSHDGEHSITFLCENAQQKDLMGLCITDHYEMELNEAQADICLRNSFIETGKSRQAFDNRLLVMSGIELGQATRNFQKADRLLNRYCFDFVIGSLHCIRDMDDFAYIDFSGLNVELILQRYFEEMLELCQWGGFDTLAHMTYPLRYIIGKYQLPVDMKPYEEIIREILKTLADKNLALEINTAGLRREIGQTSPTLEYVKLFRELGGELLTFGSDAHRAQDLGAGLDVAIDMAKEAGFSHFAFYKKREPRMLRLM